MLRPYVFSLLSLLLIPLLGQRANAQLSLDTELLTNTDFEGGTLTGWTRVSGNAKVEFYGNPAVTGPSFQVALDMAHPTWPKAKSGGQYYAKHTTGGTTVYEQVFDLTGNAQDVDAGNLGIELSGYFGGVTTDQDYSGMYAVFSDAQSRVLSTESVIGPDYTGRNRQTILLLRNSLGEVLPVPPTARTMRIELRFHHVSGSSVYASADNLSAILRRRVPPSPLPKQAELLVNGDFETKSISGQPWDGWDIVGGQFTVGLYGTTYYPPLAYRDYMASMKRPVGNYLLRHVVGGTSTLRRVLDLRGNSAQVDAGGLEFVLEGLFGGFSTESCYGYARFDFFNALGARITTQSTPAVYRDMRGMETTLLPITRSIEIPRFARKVHVELVLQHASNSITNALVDNVSVKLRDKSPAIPIPYQVNLVHNSDFEGPYIHTLEKDGGWWFESGTATAEKYGSSYAPPISASQAIGGGAQALRHTKGGTTTLASPYNLSGNQKDVDAGSVRIEFGAYFGGVGTDTDYAYMSAEFFDGLDRKLGNTISTQSVTRADRNSQSVLLLRTTDEAVPVGARRVVVRIHLVHASGNYTYACVDNVRVVFYDRFTGKAAYPGMGLDVQLLTGVDADPTGGAGADVKDAQPGQRLNIRLMSRSGTFDGEVLFVLADVFPTGAPPIGILPGIVVGPAFVFAINGYTLGGPFGPATVLPGGTDYSFMLPNIPTGTSLLLQGLVFSSQLPLGFASTNGHELKF